MTGQSVVMVTGLPLGGYCHATLVDVVWPYFLEKDVSRVLYHVVVLPLQRRVRTHARPHTVFPRHARPLKFPTLLLLCPCLLSVVFPSCLLFRPLMSPISPRLLSPPLVSSLPRLPSSPVFSPPFSSPPLHLFVHLLPSPPHFSSSLVSRPSSTLTTV